MDINETISKVTNIANDFSIRDDISIYHLLEESGYFNCHNSVTVENLFSELYKKTELIDSWLQYSEDKRSKGWYFYRVNQQKYVVGNTENKSSTNLSDKTKACAFFIKHEIEDLRLT